MLISYQHLTGETNMGYLDWIIVSITFISSMITFGFAWNFIYVESEKEFESREKMLLLLVVALLIVAIFSPLYIGKQEPGFVNLISIGGYLLSISIIGGFSKKYHKWLSKRCYMVAIAILIMAFLYLISVKINPDLKNILLFNILENIDVTSFSFAIVAILLAVEVLQKKSGIKTKN